MGRLRRILAGPINRAIVRRRDRLYVRQHYRQIQRGGLGAAVCYGWPEVPALGQKTHGGMVKIQHMQGRFPNAPAEACKLIYICSSAPPPAIESLLNIATDRGIPIVLNQNGVAYPAWCPGDAEQVNGPIRSMIDAAAHVFYQSAFCKISADRFVTPRSDRFDILHNAIDTDLYAPVIDRPTSTPDLTLLLGGSQYAAHRVQAALQTLRKLADSGRDARLIVTGRLSWEGVRDQKPLAGTWARDLGVSDRVTWLGTFTQAEASGIYHQADVLLHTQANDACPTTVLEAMACGLPVVYADSGGVGELVGAEAGVGVRDESDWEKIVPANAEALAAAVETVACDWASYAAAARERAVAKFSMTAWLEHHRALFERLTDAT